MESIEAIQLAAMAAIMQPTEGDHLYRIFRWYSKTFFVPLNKVYDLPIDDVIYTFFLESYESLDDEERLKKLEYLLATPDQKAQMDTEDISEDSLGIKDAAFFDKMNDEIKNDSVIKRTPKTTPEQTNQKGSILSKRIHQLKNKAEKLSGTNLPKVKVAQKLDLPEFNVQFGSNNLTNRINTNKFGDLDPLAPPKKNHE